jgi:PTH1 family peptidyl-tRNA hydrolase
MLLFAGLGNPTEKYKNTKHNFGFLLADQIISDYKLTIISNKNSYQLFSGFIKNQKILLIKPLQYINLSGQAIAEVKNFYKIDPHNIFVMHDDLDIEFGRIKLKLGGGNGGHNGLKDIDAKIGKNYFRLRLGIGRPENPNYEISDYVLSKFNQEELEKLDKINQKISDLLPLLLQEDKNGFSNKFYSKT